jgi:hypothetical protein
MNKICTSTKQSKKLIELGIDINTADLTVTNYPLQDGSRFDFICCKLPNDTFPSITDGKSEKIPAWSLSALLKLIPITCVLSINSGHYRIASNETNTFFHNNPLDAAFDMVCWLLENKKI